MSPRLHERPSGPRPRPPGRDEGRRSGGPEGSWQVARVVLAGAGRRDGVRPGDIVGAIVNETGLHPRSIGAITIDEESSMVELPADALAELLPVLRRVRIKGKKLTVTAAEGGGERAATPRKSFGRKPTGTLLIHDLHPGRNLYLLGTGTGFAPWLAVIKDPATYERFDRVILAHGVRHARDLAYRDYIVNELPRHEFLGEQIAARLRYYPAVTREDFVFEGRDQRGRLTEMMDSGRMMQQLGIEPLDPDRDRAMICGSPQMLADFRALLDARGFSAAPRIGVPGDYVYERAFVEK